MKILPDAVLGAVFIWQCFYTTIAVLTPTEQYACPLDTVTFTCVINQLQISFLQWSINFVEQSITPVQQTFIAGTDQPGVSVTQTNNIRQSFNFLLESVSTHDMVSTMSATIKENPDFTQLQINCNNGSITFTEDPSITFIITQAPDSTSNVTLSIEDNQDSGAIVLIRWNKSLFSSHYSVYVSNGYELSVTTTFNNSFKALLSYNFEYNISLVATNCRGSSAPISILYTVVHCSYPMVGPRVIVEGYTSGREGSQISFHCQTGLEPSDSVTSVCDRGGVWSPSPTNHKCREPSCALPLVQRNVIINSTQNFTTTAISYYCQNNSLASIPTVISICIEGKWVPNPAEYSCEDIQDSLKDFFSTIAGIAVILVMGLLVFCITSLGIVIAIAVYKKTCCRKSQRENESVVYDEIQAKVCHDQVMLKGNTAYGEINSCN